MDLHPNIVGVTHPHGFLHPNDFGVTHPWICIQIFSGGVSDDFNGEFIGRRYNGGDRWGGKEGNRADQVGSWRRGRIQGAEMEDTATSSCKSGTRSSAMADSICRQREEEENNRRLREQAWDTGVFTRRADTPVGAKILASPTVSSNSGQGVNHVIISGEEPRPDEGDVGFVLDLNASIEEQVQDGEGGDCAELQARGDGDGGIPWSLTQNSDPFNLGPLIVAAQCRDEGRLKRKGPDSMWERDDESVRYDKRFRSGNQGGCSRTSGTSGTIMVSSSSQRAFAVHNNHLLDTVSQESNHNEPVTPAAPSKGRKKSNHLTNIETYLKEMRKDINELRD
ncbi:hypothetical protein ACE6H2_015674 [Prunus campanulata]